MKMLSQRMLTIAKNIVLEFPSAVMSLLRLITQRKYASKDSARELKDSSLALSSMSIQKSQQLPLQFKANTTPVNLIFVIHVVL